jgi:hypothetical protein
VHSPRWDTSGLQAANANRIIGSTNTAEIRPVCGFAVINLKVPVQAALRQGAEMPLRQSRRREHSHLKFRRRESSRCSDLSGWCIIAP